MTSPASDGRPVRRRQRRPVGVGALPLLLLLACGSFGGAYAGMQLRAAAAVLMGDPAGDGRGRSPDAAPPNPMDAPLNFN